MNKEYLLENKILIKKEAYSLLSEIDTIIFDIDGVLVDVSSSYHQTIIDTVQYYFCNIINMQGKENLVDKNTITGFKMIGGFNNDWELAAAVVLFYLWKMKEYHTKSLEELKERHLSIDDFIKENLSNGGGLPQLITWVKENSCNVEDVLALWNKKKIFQIAKEFYAGKKNCFHLYGFHPEIVTQTEGNIEKEIILIESEISEILKSYQVGILTGRIKTETRFIIEQIGWSSWVDPEMVVTSEDFSTKPSPDGLDSLLGKFKSKMGLYIGDTMDDLLTVKNLNHHHGKLHCLSVLVLGNGFLREKGQKEYYMKNNVDLLAANVNQVVELVHGLFY